jgi:hypothetical protein
MHTGNGQYRSLTSIQAALIISLVYNFCGLDKLGSVYGLQALAIAQDQRLFHESAHVTSERLRDARHFTAWSLFNIDR